MQQNSLRGEAKPAFHAKLALVIFDNSERISEQGTLEYWWDHAAGSYLTATSPSLGTTHNLSVSEVSNDKARRVAFWQLVCLRISCRRQLLWDRPVPRWKVSSGRWAPPLFAAYAAFCRTPPGI